MEDDPLQALLLDANQIDRARLAVVLTDLVGVDTQSGRVVIKPAFAKLDVRRRLVAFLLGQKVAVLLGKAAEETLPPKEIIASTGIPAGSVHPALKDLREKRLVSSAGDGSYFVAAHQIDMCLALIEGGK